jgi:hypothetical protein
MSHLFTHIALWITFGSKISRYSRSGVPELWSYDIPIADTHWKGHLCDVQPDYVARALYEKSIGIFDTLDCAFMACEVPIFE